MIVKIVTFFLIFMAILAMFGRLRVPKIMKGRGKGHLPKPVYCKTCGRYNVTGRPCPECPNKGGGDGAA